MSPRKRKLTPEQEAAEAFYEKPKPGPKATFPCFTCGKQRDVSEFAPDSLTCKTCRRELGVVNARGEVLRRSQAAHAEAARREAMKPPPPPPTLKHRKWGLTPQEHAALYAAQDGRCAICRREARLVLDHCHDTGIWRGLICGLCNTGLGMLSDNLETVERAAAYLRAFHDRATNENESTEQAS